eukprot:3588061-Pyramimonas_sp.AAC.1
MYWANRLPTVPSHLYWATRPSRSRGQVASAPMTWHSAADLAIPHFRRGATLPRRTRSTAPPAQDPGCSPDPTAGSTPAPDPTA